MYFELGISSKPTSFGISIRTGPGRPFCAKKKPLLINSRSFLKKSNSVYFLASAKNCAKPLSVKGWFSKATIALNGAVITSAPILAHCIICIG